MREQSERRQAVDYRDLRAIRCSRRKGREKHRSVEVAYDEALASRHEPRL